MTNLDNSALFEPSKPVNTPELPPVPWTAADYAQHWANVLGYTVISATVGALVWCGFVLLGAAAGIGLSQLGRAIGLGYAQPALMLASVIVGALLGFAGGVGTGLQTWTELRRPIGPWRTSKREQS